jgi:hypothetical protein
MDGTAQARGTIPFFSSIVPITESPTITTTKEPKKIKSPLPNTLANYIVPLVAASPKNRTLLKLTIMLSIKNYVITNQAFLLVG